MAKFYVTWQVAESVGVGLLHEEIEAGGFAEAESQTRERFASGLVDLTEAMAPSLAGPFAESKRLSDSDRTRLEGELKRETLDIARIFIPSHQIVQVGVSTRPLKKNPTGDS